ncbi:MAG: YabP/YqfC family sporulation protein [Bacilli bacterium]|nr:YabP/YqfC family sporulation protein [Bacilli bacterium]
MKVYDRLKSCFINKDYCISLSNNYIYIINYKEILEIDDKKIIVSFDNFSIVITGYNFKIKRKLNIEIEISGQFSKVEIIK